MSDNSLAATRLLANAALVLVLLALQGWFLATQAGRLAAKTASYWLDPALTVAPSVYMLDAALAGRTA